MAISLVLDCADVDRAASFWGPALRYQERGRLEQYALLGPETGEGPELILQRVPEPKTGKNRMHFDIKAADIEAEAARLEGLGARRTGEGALEAIGEHWIV